MKPCITFIVLWLVSVSTICAQDKIIISGFIRDNAIGEDLIGASIYAPALKTGVTTNEYGFYSITLPAGKQTLIYSYVGYKSIALEVEGNQNQILDVKLDNTIELQEVVIKADGIKKNEDSQMSKSSMSLEQIKRLPAFLGEVDVMKSIQLLPGIKGGTEGSSGIYVRGGGPDQNLILLDGVPVYNVNHLFGFFSVFNGDAINSIDIYTGSFPARYGGRLSSVLDIRMREGNKDHITGSVSIGLIASKFTVEGPIKKGKSSFIISGRRTYIDALAQPFILAATKGLMTVGYYFYDFNAKYNYKLGEDDRIFISGYFGNDKFYASNKSVFIDNTQKEKFGLHWGNITAVARWNHIWSNKLFNNITINYTRYRFSTYVSQESETNGISNNIKLKYFSGIRDWSLRNDLDWYPNNNHQIRTGGAFTYHVFKPGAIQFNVEDNGSSTIDTTLKTDFKQALETAVFIEDDVKLGSRIKMNLGIHYSNFYVDNTFFNSVQPRLSARYNITDGWSIKVGYAAMTQYLHLLSNSGIGLPTDLWVPVTKRLQPQQSQQAALGTAIAINDKIDLTIEGYYKTMKNLFEYKNGTSYITGFESWERKLARGKGLAYGCEVLFQKQEGKTTGLLGYTISWSTRTFDQEDNVLNFGKTFYYRYDRRHDVSIAVTHKFSDRIILSGVWIYGSGNAVSLPIASYMGQYGMPINYYEGRNGFRMAPTHRLDVGISFIKKRKRGERTWNISVYNAYNRKNPFFVLEAYNTQDNSYYAQVSLFPIIPAFSYNFKFN